MKDNVAVAACSTYDRDSVYLAVVKVITSARNFPQVKGKRVLVKPNLLTFSKDCIERCVCTNPEVVYAVGKFVLEQGGILEIADTPGGRLTPTIVKMLYRDCGISKVADDLGIMQNYNIEIF